MHGGNAYLHAHWSCINLHLLSSSSTTKLIVSWSASDSESRSKLYTLQKQNLAFGFRHL